MWHFPDIDKIFFCQRSLFSNEFQIFKCWLFESCGKYFVPIWFSERHIVKASECSNYKSMNIFLDWDAEDLRTIHRFRHRHPNDDHLLLTSKSVYMWFFQPKINFMPKLFFLNSQLSLNSIRQYWLSTNTKAIISKTYIKVLHLW